MTTGTTRVVVIIRKLQLKKILIIFLVFYFLPVALMQNGLGGLKITIEWT